MCEEEFKLKNKKANEPFWHVQLREFREKDASSSNYTSSRTCYLIHKSLT